LLLFAVHTGLRISEGVLLRNRSRGAGSAIHFSDVDNHIGRVLLARPITVSLLLYRGNTLSSIRHQSRNKPPCCFLRICPRLPAQGPARPWATGR